MQFIKKGADVECKARLGEQALPLYQKAMQDIVNEVQALKESDDLVD